MVIYRISNCTYIRDLSGQGAALYGGRWNSRNTYMVYTAQSRALALLETVVHIGKVPRVSFCMATIEMPDTSIATIPLASLPADWSASPSPDHLKALGDRFIASGKYLALQVPSVVMMEEHN